MNLDEIFIRGNIERIEKEEDYILYTSYDFELLNQRKKVKNYLKLEREITI